MKSPTTFRALACAVTVLCAGCGDGGGERPAAELTGVFQAGGVSGLRYVTQTRSGFTDSAGSFKYLAGESVVFYVGGIKLGLAPADPRVSPFTLVGMTPPVTEPALRRELDRASRTTTDFVRAANMTRLLLALDADGNPANGIDLRGRDAELANATLDFGETIPQFAESLEKLAPDLVHNMPRWLPIVHLYRSLAITVPVHAPANYDYDNGGLTAWGTVFSYYPNGSVESRASHDNYAPFASSTTFRYDALGRITSTRTERQSYPGESFIEENVETYDARGNLVRRIREVDEGLDGTIDSSRITDFRTDAFANILGEVTRLDSGHDGIIDSLETYEAQFNARRNIESSTWRTDSNMDGVTDSQVTFHAQYDSAHRPVVSTSETDAPVDGIVDSRYSTSATYAVSGPDVAQVYEDDWTADGIAELRVTYDWRHDSNGNLRTLTITSGNSISDPRNRQVITFDSDRRVLTEVTSGDRDGNGVFDTVDRRTNTYDPFGKLLEAEDVSETDYAGAPRPGSRYVTRYEYGAGGELLRSEQTYYPPSGGAPSVTNGLRVTNMPVADGVLLLAQSYLEFSFLTGAVAAF